MGEVVVVSNLGEGQVQELPEKVIVELMHDEQVVAPEQVLQTGMQAKQEVDERQQPWEQLVHTVAEVQVAHPTVQGTHEGGLPL